MPTEVGETCTLRLTLTDDDIREGAARVHDLNPIHHDLGAARAAGYPALVASGAHTGAIFMGITATHFSAPYVSTQPSRSLPRAMLGLGFDFRFRAVVFGGEPLTMRWAVTGGDWKASLGGWIVEAEGSVLTPRGPALVGTTRFLLRSPGASS